MTQTTNGAAAYRCDDYANYWDDPASNIPRGFAVHGGVLFHEGRAVCDAFRVIGLRFTPSNSLQLIRRACLIVSVGGAEVAIEEGAIMASGGWGERERGASRVPYRRRV